MCKCFIITCLNNIFNLNLKKFKLIFLNKTLCNYLHFRPSSINIFSLESNTSLVMEAKGCKLALLLLLKIYRQHLSNDRSMRHATCQTAEDTSVNNTNPLTKTVACSFKYTIEKLSRASILTDIRLADLGCRRKRWWAPRTRGRVPLEVRREGGATGPT